MTDQTKIQITYTLSGSPADGFRIERTEDTPISIYQRLALLFSEVRTVHKAIVAAEIKTKASSPDRAELDANAVILSLVARTLESSTSPGVTVEAEELDCGDEPAVIH